MREHAVVGDVVNAFVLGVLSALSLGLGAFTSRLWKPTNFVLGLLGGLAFEGLNRVINARRGFLRKASTSIMFLRDREQHRRRQILEDLERIEIFDGLPDRELDSIAKVFRTARLDAVPVR